MTADAAVLGVDLDALASNYAVLKAAAGDAEVFPVVKADAYGLGVGPIARRLRAEGARSFFVGRLAEGEALRETIGDRGVEILVLDGAVPDTVDRLRAADLTPVLNTPGQVRAWGGRPAAVQVGTGMNRLGLDVTEAQALQASLAATQLISHLACASDPGHPMNGEQLERFCAARAVFPQARASLANSAGVFLGPGFAFDFVRPGISLYGGGPFGRPDPRFKAVASLTAPILQVRDIVRGDTVGYGATFTAQRPTRVATVAAGYCDGVMRSAGGGAHAFLDGERLPYIGRVSMDLIALDATDAPAAREGVIVELLGPNILIDDLANAASTIAYEVLVRLGSRARAARRYLGEA